MAEELPITVMMFQPRLLRVGSTSRVCGLPSGLQWLIRVAREEISCEKYHPKFGSCGSENGAGSNES